MCHDTSELLKNRAQITGFYDVSLCGLCLTRLSGHLCARYRLLVGGLRRRRVL